MVGGAWCGVMWWEGLGVDWYGGRGLAVNDMVGWAWWGVIC